ncbi:citrate lyase subunit beta/citryl-CoA lyase [Pseudochelatococcus lubricantis]|uniref:Citrate lyase subunit beta/citryl-CoA lyase n=1 Tax=Pseudochelatococcus lubricantis TaxID=1538102 RepID=A0ABX0UYL1_9HYPH|nr:CoA ester lyase [Pseudochelatococcus lubricantis]NIJ57020.1 citrate lyase subunit beta/citryl-CoA lyase [Pseudochelatococcus lubricantis]
MTATIRPRRSLLFVPASNVRALEKARGLPSDAVIIDLEDAVAPAAKEAAREQARAAIAQGLGGREVALRVNGADTPWGADDLALAASVAPDAVLVPKAASAEAVRDIGRRLDALGAPARVQVWAMIETARAVLDADAMARTALEPASRLALFVIGANDLARETGVRVRAGRAALLPWLQQVLLAARASGLAAIDSVYNDFSDTAGFAAECAQGRDLGFDGKSLIHPAQIAAANAAFGPGADDIAEARALIAAFTAPENAGKGAVSFEGRMIEDLHVAIARRTLALADAIAALHHP